MLLLKAQWNLFKMQTAFWPLTKPTEHAAPLEIGEPAVLIQKGAVTAARVQGCQVSWHMWKDKEELPGCSGSDYRST